MTGDAIGILGGSFDPVHLTHTALGAAAFEQCGLSELLFVPARQAALKPDTVCASAQDRLEMLKIAVGKLPFNCRIETCEIGRAGVSYSIDTARYLRQKYGDGAKLVWIIGGDHIAKLSKWKDIDELCSLVEFACAGRPDCAADKSLLPQCAKVKFIDFELSPLSSSEIRRLAAEGKFLNSMLDADVISYIKDHNLYKQTLL